MDGANMIPFISHDDLGAYLKTTLTGDELLTKIALDGACEAVRQELHRTLNLTQDDAIVLEPTWTDALILPERPAHEVSLVTIDGASVATENLYLNVERGVLSLIDGSIWTSARHGIGLTYTHGYALDEGGVSGTIERVPSNIRLVALRLAAAVYRSSGKTAAGAITGENIGTFRYTQDAAAATELAAISITDDDRKLLAAQRAVFAA
jgi:hypothetical protein